MDKKEEFKIFAKKHPELINYINNNSNVTWQKLYEIYDIYGDDLSTWEPYFKQNNNIVDIFKNVNMSKIQEHVNTAQKALNLIEELTTKGSENLTNLKGPAIPRPITKFFGD